MKKTNQTEISCIVSNVDEAIKYAEKLRKKGTYDLFRGQIHDFPLVASIFRKENNVEASIMRLNRLANWINNKPELQSIQKDKNSILVIAQHYGIPTPLIDFSYDPKVAGFFATKGELPKNRNPKDPLSCIICVKQEMFEKSWDKINNRENEEKYAEIININVQNLWRLETQKGVFIKNNIGEPWFEMFSHLYRIYFPYEEQPKRIPEEMIYPKVKSHLEILLDQFFSDEKREIGQKKFEEKIFGGNLIAFHRNEPVYGVSDDFIKKKLPSKHNSWMERKIKKWVLEPNENFADIVSDKKIIIKVKSNQKIKNIVKHIQDQLFRELKKDEKLRNKSIVWEIVDYNGNSLTIDNEIDDDNEETFKQIECKQFVSTIWDGMRRLPYSNQQISNCIANYIALVSSNNDNKIEELLGENHWIEFDSGGFVAMACVSEKKLLESIREDIFELINSERKKEIKKSVFHIGGELLRSLVVTEKLFDYEKFVELFATEIIPTQIIFNISYDAFCFSPVQVKILGHR